MLTTKDIESSNIIFDGNINVINAADANSFPVTCDNNLESDKEILQIARDIAIIKGQYDTICRMHASLLVTCKNIDERLKKMERKHVIPSGEVQYQLLRPLLPLKCLQHINNFEELITTNDSALSQYVSI
ncbi:PREDICTED: uncharacterized protein LOC108769497 isoform X2 [Trachymyrmex cornetzi]|uniref:uncharacterized protein LOC108769497 isoform X2 n=1 Tax=Trachymyrmex cornetzi TaxID=471704 RepID=UPI00084F034D|nr:PREDICTED: uncharacterized protein LOC108769497 isoform X2 [Trachymyrmex cornetzi]